jgi:hypothetical protein
MEHIDIAWPDIYVLQDDVREIFNLDRLFVRTRVVSGELPSFRPFEGSSLVLIRLPEAARWYEALPSDTRGKQRLAHRRAAPDPWRSIAVRRPDIRKRDIARAISSDAHNKGLLTRKPCTVCGAVPAEGHHTDYDRPLDVVYLCVRHHRQEDRRSRKGLRLASLASERAVRAGIRLISAKSLDMFAQSSVGAQYPVIL